MLIADALFTVIKDLNPKSTGGGGGSNPLVRFLADNF